MTPREIIDKIKAHPAKERANEIMICNSIIEPLNDAHNSILKNYQDTFNDTNKPYKSVDNQINLVHSDGKIQAYKECMEIIREHIAKYEWWIKEGNFGYIPNDFLNE